MDPMFPGSTPPSTIGGTIATPTSTTLAAMDVKGLPLGTVAWNIAVGQFFKLTASTASLVTDQIVEVKDTVGSRWILTVVGVPTPAQFFAQTDVRSTALVAPAQSMSITPLVGATDGDYRIYFYIDPAATTGVLRFQYNGVNTDLYSFRSKQLADDSVTLSHSTSTCTFSDGCLIAEEISGWIDFRSGIHGETFGFRTGIVTCFGGTGPTTDRTVFTLANTTAITSVRILAANAASLGLASYMFLRKLNHQF